MGPGLGWLRRHDVDYVRDVLSRQIYPYREIHVPKRTGGRRVLHAPEEDLMMIQRELLDRCLAREVPHPAAYAYRSGTSVLECARQHLDAHTVIRLDIASFFRSIRERHVFTALLNVDLTAQSAAVRLSKTHPTRLVAYEIALLTTVSPPGKASWANRGTGNRKLPGEWSVSPRNFVYRGMRQGFLPQGAPTSGALSNLVLREVDEEIFEAASRLGMRYTRYSDDLYFSSRKAASHESVNVLVRSVRAVLEKLDLHLNDAKTRVARPGSRRSVLGILVDGSTARLPREVHREIELHLRGADRRGMSEHAAVRGFRSAEELTVHVEGLIAWSRHVQPDKGSEQLEHWRRCVQRSRTLHNPRATDSVGTVSDQSTAPEAVARESIDRLLAEGQTYRESKDYADFISFIGRFRTYAPFNAAMVKLQRPGARYVLTEAAWRSEYGRVLRPGAQPLVIMRPGGPYMVVYDVGDTEALPGSPPLPADVTDPLAAASVATPEIIQRRWDASVDNAIADGIRVTLVNHAGSHAGSAGRSRRGGEIERPGRKASSPVEKYRLVNDVQINQNLPLLDRYVTLVHELGHIYLGHVGGTDPRRWPARPGDRRRNEVEAETVAYIVMARLDPAIRMGDYLLDYLNKDEPMPEDLGLRQMILVATHVMRMGDARLSGQVADGSLRTDAVSDTLF